MRRFLVHLRRAFWKAFVEHDAIGVAKGSAYSAVFTIFPALLVAAAAVAALPDSYVLRLQLGLFFDRIFPEDVSPILQSYFSIDHSNPRSLHVLLVAIAVSITGATGVITTLMEGFRRAHSIPITRWSFWTKRRKAIILVFLSLVPIAITSTLVVFGNFITLWIAHLTPGHLQPAVYVIATILRWIVTLLGTASLIAVIYHLGTPTNLSWRHALPGAAFATIMWFISTLIFGWYVTHFANYSQVYGSLGAGIALLVWLYITSLSVLCGAELNAELAANHYHLFGE